MRKRRWRVELRAHAQSDGLERLGQMVRLVIGHAVGRGGQDNVEVVRADGADTGCSEQWHEVTT